MTALSMAWGRVEDLIDKVHNRPGHIGNVDRMGANDIGYGEFQDLVGPRAPISATCVTPG